MSLKNWIPFSDVLDEMTYQTMDQRILDLEHATMWPLGEDPEHCERCREVARVRQLQATCSHPDHMRQTVDITAFGDTVIPRLLVQCRRCGKQLPQ